jgi:hypothetical protein
MTLKAYEVIHHDGTKYELLLSEHDKDAFYPDAKESKTQPVEGLDSTFEPETYEELRTPEDRAREERAAAEAKSRTVPNKARGAAGK